MSTKTYVLLPHTESTAPIYLRLNKNQRIRLTKRPVDHAYLQITCALPVNGDPERTTNRTLRLKLSSNSIFQDDQIKEGIPANVPFTPAERKAVEFRHGVLVTKNEVVQKFLDSHPQNEAFKGQCDSIKQPLFREYIEANDVKNKNQEMRKRVEAANKILALNLDEAHNLLLKINGSFFDLPGSKAKTEEEITAATEKCQNMLMDWMDETDEAGLDRLLEDITSNDDKIKILIGKAVNKGVLSFSQNNNQVSLNKSGKWVDVKMISSETPAAERERLFAEYLSSKDGELLLADITKMVEGVADTSAKEEARKKK